MTITIGEDTYISLETANLLNQDIPDWATTGDPDKEKALRAAAEFIESCFVGRFKGTITNETQVMLWPRQNVVDIEGREVASTHYPLRLQKAQAYLANKARTEELLPDIAVGAQVVKQKVGPIDTTFKAGVEKNKNYQYAEKMLKSYVTGSKYIKKIRRAL